MLQGSFGGREPIVSGEERLMREGERASEIVVYLQDSVPLYTRLASL